MNMMVCEPVPSGCGCPPGHFCWHCLKDTFGDKIADLLINHPDLVPILNAERMGVTDGSPALPGQVGEWISGSAPFAIPALGAGNTYGNTVLALVLPPGDWMVFPDASWSNYYPSVAFGLGLPLPSGVSNQMLGGLWGTGDPYARIAVGVPAHANLANPAALVFNVAIGAAGATGVDTLTMRAQAYRIR